MLKIAQRDHKDFYYDRYLGPLPFALPAQRSAGDDSDERNAARYRFRLSRIETSASRVSRMASRISDGSVVCVMASA